MKIGQRLSGRDLGQRAAEIAPQHIRHSTLIGTLTCGVRRHIVRGSRWTLSINSLYSIYLEKTSHHSRITSPMPKEIGARQHEIEIVEHGHSDVWITCRHSPRFIWKRCLNHHEAGLNLDFAAQHPLLRNGGMRTTILLAAYCPTGPFVPERVGLNCTGKSYNRSTISRKIYPFTKLC